jgi:hypothetical protein
VASCSGGPDRSSALPRVYSHRLTTNLLRPQSAREIAGKPSGSGHTRHFTPKFCADIESERRILKLSKSETRPPPSSSSFTDYPPPRRRPARLLPPASFPDKFALTYHTAAATSPEASATMAGVFRRLYDWLLRTFWATEMDVTMVGLQNAGKTSLLRVLSVSRAQRFGGFEPRSLTHIAAGRELNSRSSKFYPSPNFPNPAGRCDLSSWHS